MSRIRTIKPEWLDDEQLALASSDARVLSVAAILLADDYGNGRGNPKVLGPRVFPGNPKIIEPALDELIAINYLQLYANHDQLYFAIRTWSEHQRVDRPGKPRVPPPNGSQTFIDLADSRKIAGDTRKIATDRDHDHDHIPRSGSSASASADVRTVFDCWKNTHCKQPDRALLNRKRTARIKARLSEGYSADFLCSAIRGALNDSWIMGTDPKSPRPYRDLETLLRDGSQVERLAALDGQPTTNRRGPAPIAPREAWGEPEAVEPTDEKLEIRVVPIKPKPKGRR